jgi:hypothetical protein
MDANNIKVVLSYGTAITSISNVRIDTIVIDIIAITSFFFPFLLFYNGHSIHIIPDRPIYNRVLLANFWPSKHDSGFEWVQVFWSTWFLFIINDNLGSISIATSTYSGLDYTFINFIYLGCPTAFSYFDSLNMLCHDSYCNSIGYYWFISLDLCQPCLYDCLSCANRYSCSSCISTNYRVYDPLTQRCPPIPGNFDDGTNNPVASFCISPCLTCTALLFAVLVSITTTS